MLITGQVGKKEKKNKRPRRGPQTHNFRDQAIEVDHFETCAKLIEFISDPRVAYRTAWREVQMMQLREARDKWKAGTYKKIPRERVKAVWTMTQEEQDKYIREGSRSFPIGHPVKQISDCYNPSTPLRNRLKSHLGID